MLQYAKICVSYWLSHNGPGNDKQDYVVCISVSRDNGKITKKETSKLFFQNYNCQYGLVKYHRNVNFEEMDTECLTGKNCGF